MSDSSQPHGLQPNRFLRPWDFSSKSIGVGCHCCLLQVLVKCFFNILNLCLRSLSVPTYYFWGLVSSLISLHWILFQVDCLFHLHLLHLVKPWNSFTSALNWLFRILFICVKLVVSSMFYPCSFVWNKFLYLLILFHFLCEIKWNIYLSHLWRCALL